MSISPKSAKRKPTPKNTRVGQAAAPGAKSSVKSLAKPRLSRTRRPPELEVADWQAGLRRQFGREQNFGLKNLGGEPVFSEFRVSNPASGTHYRVAIRGQAPGQNYCSCPDFATNNLGTCKHIEFTLGKLLAKRGGKAALKSGFAPPYSEIWLDYAGQRQLRFRAGTDCPARLQSKAQVLFDTNANWALRPERLHQLELLLQTAQDTGHELRCYDDAWQFRPGRRRA